MFARLYADQLALSGEGSVHVFDTDHPRGGLAHYFPENSEIVDLQKTGGQVRLFDTMIEHPERSYVVDLQASLLTRFFRIFEDIAFDEGARQSGIGVVVFFLIDRQLQSIQAAESIREKLRCSEFVLVLNEAIGSPLHIPEAAIEFEEMDKDRYLVLPELSEAAIEYTESPGFSFGSFIAGGAKQVPLQLRRELWNFLEAIYNQRRAGGSGTTHLI